MVTGTQLAMVETHLVMTGAKLVVLTETQLMIVDDGDRSITGNDITGDGRETTAGVKAQVEMSTKLSSSLGHAWHFTSSEVLQGVSWCDALKGVLK